MEIKLATEKDLQEFVTQAAHQSDIDSVESSVSSLSGQVGTLSSELTEAGNKIDSKATKLEVDSLSEKLGMKSDVGHIHDSSEVSFSSSDMTASNVQDAIVELKQLVVTLQTEIDNLKNNQG